MDQVSPVWSDDMRVLTAIYLGLQDGGLVRAEHIEQRTGLSKEFIWESTGRLERADYLGGKISRTMGMGVIISPFNTTERGLRQVGAWPSADAMPDRLIESISEYAEREPDAARRKTLLDMAKSAATEVGRAALREWVRASMGG